MSEEKEKTNQSIIEHIVSAYFPSDQFSDETRRLATFACENVEREVRQDIAKNAYELANQIINRKCVKKGE